MTIITVAFFARWTCRLISMQWYFCMDWTVVECRSLTYFRGRTHFSLFCNVSLSFNANDDGITVLKQNTNCAVILAKILSYLPRAVSPHFLEALPSSVLMTILLC